MAKDLNGYSDPYCVVKINSEVKYRTRVKKKTLNPEWEETLMTHLPRHPDILAIVSIRLSKTLYKFKCSSDVSFQHLIKQKYL